MMDLKISILIPIYNSAPFLQECLNSVLKQTYSHLQIVLIDDGSTDNSWEIMQSYKVIDKRIEIFHQDNRGVATTRNKLIEKAIGDYVLFVDSDDWLELNTLETIVSAINEKEYDIVSFEMVGSKNTKDFELSQEQAIKLFLEHVVFSGSLCNKVCKRELFKGLHFKSFISYGEDALMTWCLLQRVRTVRMLPNQFYHYRMNDSSLSHQTFGEKKKTGHKVWQSIVDDTNVWWPQYSDVARARFAAEDMWQLYFAARDNYPKDDYIKMVQSHVRKDFSLLSSSGLLNKKKLVFAWLVSHNYCLGRLLL